MASTSVKMTKVPLPCYLGVSPLLAYLAVTHSEMLTVLVFVQFKYQFCSVFDKKEYEFQLNLLIRCWF